MESTDDYGCVCAHAEPFHTQAEAVAYEGGDNFGVSFEPVFDWAAYNAPQLVDNSGSDWDIVEWPDHDDFAL
jgi:hypothetical protein